MNISKGADKLHSCLNKQSTWISLQVCERLKWECESVLYVQNRYFGVWKMG